MATVNVRYRLLETPWGVMAIVARGDKLVGVLLPERSPKRLAAEVASRWPGAEPAPRLLPGLAKQVADYFAGRRPRFDVECDLSLCTEFQRRVLGACRRIAAGKTETYGSLAHRIGRRGAARAVGRAMAANPIPLVIPCHRVVASGGRLGGFSARGGGALKRRLLDHERRAFC